jgi:hypothetical protein
MIDTVSMCRPCPMDVLIIDSVTRQEKLLTLLLIQWYDGYGSGVAPAAMRACTTWRWPL